MKKAAKDITGVSTASIVSLRAIIAKEKTSRSTRPVSSSSTSTPPKSNKGVAERARKDEVPLPPVNKPKKVVYIAGVPYREYNSYYQEENEKDQLVDIESKLWEQMEKDEELQKVRFRAPESEEDMEAQRRAERRDLIFELASDTAKGREQHRESQAKRERDKMARLELIKAKASKLKGETPARNDVEPDHKHDTSWIYGDDEENGDEDSSEAIGSEPVSKRPKLAED